MYVPNSQIENTWNLHYENYSTGETFTRVGMEQPFTLQDILQNRAKNSNTLFKNKHGITSKFNKSLIVAENILCENKKYTFEFPQSIVNLTINRQLVPYLLKMNKMKILQYLSNVQYKRIPSEDPSLPKKLKQFMSKKISLERQKYIDGLREFGFSGDDDLWDLYTLEQLKSEYNQVVKK